MKQLLSLAILMAVFACSQQPDEQFSQQPNVVLILTDDQGYGDYSMNDNPWVETPVIDQLAGQGVLFSNFFVSPVCAPTRASLLTGRHFQRTGVTGVTRGRENMSLEEQTMADIFGKNGYATGIFGKWHNGAHYPYHPNGRGFDEFYGFCSGHWTNYFDTELEHNGRVVQSKGYIVDDITDMAINFIEKNQQENNPFFCYLSINTPHTPLQVPGKYFEKYKVKGLDDFNAAIYGMCDNIDFNVGRVLGKLDDLGIRENTIILYLSDNGPVNDRFNAGLKGLKAGTDEGGVKTPFILNWEGRLKPQVLGGIGAHIDILPTLVELTGIEANYKNAIDGKSLIPMMEGEVQEIHENIPERWHQKTRLRTSKYLVVNDALYDIKADPGQSSDIRIKYPAVFDSLQRVFEKWDSEVKNDTKTDFRIPLGYAAFPNSYLPAHEANLHPCYTRDEEKSEEISYHAYYGWANDWIDDWTSTDAYITWDIEVVEVGVFDFAVEYNCKPRDTGVLLNFEVQEHEKIIEVTEPFYSDLKDLPDRVEIEAEAPEKVSWGLLELGAFPLKKGASTIKLSSLEIPGEKSLEIKGIRVKRVDVD
jgi:arylsulfatase A-like enzyme